MNTISVQHLSKAYTVSHKKGGLFSTIKTLFAKKTTRLALDDVSFSINEGELVGYIGPNGAGKSTTVKILSGILLPTQGDVKVLGLVPWRHRVEIAQQIGVVFGQKSQLWWDLPVKESFTLLRDLYRIQKNSYNNTLEELSHALQLEPLFNTPVRQLSLGERMRCDLAASLLHRPKILFLDEPTIGLDALSKRAVREFILKRNQTEKITILLTTHDMDDIEALCPQRVLVVQNGRLFFDQPLSALREKLLPERWLILDLEDSLQNIEDHDATLMRREGGRVWLRFSPSKTSAPALIARITAKYQVRDLYVENPPIDAVIAQLYREMSREEKARQ